MVASTDTPILKAVAPLRGASFVYLSSTFVQRLLYFCHSFAPAGSWENTGARTPD